MKPNCTYCLFLIFILVRINMVNGQESDIPGGKTEIIQDARIDLLVQKHIRINEVINTIDGFRIQIFSESGASSKTKAQAVHEEFQARYPGVGVYLTFKTPNYRIRTGDFRTKLDAQRFLIELTADYPNAFIVEDQINLPKTE
jgi:hypothetical protein